MNKKFLVTAAVLSVVLFISFSCTNKTGTAPVGNTVTPTQTVTATATRTSTALPAPVTIDNFEDNDNYPSVICSGCTNAIMHGLSVGTSYFSRGCYALSGAPVDLGSYAYGMTCTVNNDGNAWYMLNFQTYSAAATGSDFSMYNRINLRYKINTNAAPADIIQMSVTLSDDTQAHRLEKNTIALDKTGSWQTLSLDLYTFANESTTLTAAQVLAQVAGIRVYLRSSGDGLGTAHIECSLDNITLSAE